MVVLRNHHKKKGYIAKAGEAIAQVILMGGSMTGLIVKRRHRPQVWLRL